jgi:hypothetical protein
VPHIKFDNRLGSRIRIEDHERVLRFFSGTEPVGLCGKCPSKVLALPLYEWHAQFVSTEDY